MQQELEPIMPERAKEMYLNARKHEVSQSTFDGYHYRLKHFIRWCDKEGIDNMNDLTGRNLQEFRTWRRDDGELKPVTLEGNPDALRVFIRWCKSYNTVPEGLHDKQSAGAVQDNSRRPVGLVEGVSSFWRRHDYD